LKLNPHFTRLNLSDNGIRNTGCVALGTSKPLLYACLTRAPLVAVLKQHPRLASLDVSHNQISQQGGEALLELIKSNPNLKQVNFNTNRLDAALRLKLKAALEDNARGAGRAA
jgi:hypothetical protein